MRQDELEWTEREISTTLGVWAVGSVIKGGAIALIGRRTGRQQWTRFGRQTAMWGAVDAAIAGVGTLLRNRRGDLTPERVDQEVAKLRRLLLINAAADVVYMVGSTVIVARGHAGRTTWRMGRGDGLAILIQGAFLLVLDTTYARKLSA